MKLPGDIKTEAMRFLIARIERSKGEGWECLALIGKGFTDSIYKLFLRRGKGMWLRIEYGVGPSGYDPVKYQARLDPKRALPPENVIHGGLSNLKGLKVHPDKTQLIIVMEAIQNVLGR